jgi:hypothetical protein
MKQIAILFILIPTILFSLETPVSIQIKKVSESKYSLKISVPPGFAIQKEAPNKLKLSAEGNLKINSYTSDFSGPTLLSKPEYYESLNDFDVQMKGSGTLQIDSKIYYCDIQKGICYPGKISKRESIQ